MYYHDGELRILYRYGDRNYFFIFFMYFRDGLKMDKARYCVTALHILPLSKTSLFYNLKLSD
jgi:hypothetical protein